METPDRASQYLPPNALLHDTAKGDEEILWFYSFRLLPNACITKHLPIRHYMEIISHKYTSIEQKKTKCKPVFVLSILVFEMKPSNNEIVVRSE